MLDALETLQERVLSVEAELEQTHRLATLGTLAAGMVHELRNLLTPVLAYAQLAEREDDDPDAAQKVVELARHNLAVAGEIIDATLNFARPTNEAERPVANVKSSVDNALRCLARDPRKDGVDVLREIPDDLAVRMPTVPLQQIILNLVTNALKAMRSGGGAGKGRRIEIRAAETQDGMIQIEVADNGPGIPDAVRVNLFRPFVTTAGLVSSDEDGDADEPDGVGAKQTTNTSVSCGLGLGLAICRRLVEEAGGTISVADTPGGGATFRVILPSA